MFTKPTVFIVGAGASYEVAMPVGADLLKLISLKLDFVIEDYSSGVTAKHGDQAILNALVSEYGRAEVEKYLNAAKEMRPALALAFSIDNFLHAHADNPLYTTLGKLGISSVLMEKESKSIIATKQQSNETIRFGSLAGNWLSIFVRMLFEGRQKRDLEKLFDNITIITFNYDRCIEHFVSHAVAAYFSIPLLESQKLCADRLNVIHVYGQIGFLPWQKDSGETSSFGRTPDHPGLFKISRELRTFTEGARDEDFLEEIHTAIRSAQVVAYLGFSFLKMNMDLMSTKRAGKYKRIYGTAYKVSDSNRETASNSITNTIASNDNIVEAVHLAPKDCTCEQFLQDYWGAILY